jgi:hypothetical protein
MPPFTIARFSRESLHPTRKGGLFPAATKRAGVLGARHGVHFFAMGDGPERNISGIFTASACFRGTPFLITAMI